MIQELCHEIGQLKQALAAKDLALAQASRHKEELFAKVVEKDRDIAKWKAAHDEMVGRNRLLRDRPDLPADRIRAHDEWVENQEQRAEIARLREALKFCAVDRILVDAGGPTSPKGALMMTRDEFIEELELTDDVINPGVFSVPARRILAHDAEQRQRIEKVETHNATLRKALEDIVGNIDVMSDRALLLTQIRAIAQQAMKEHQP